MKPADSATASIRGRALLLAIGAGAFLGALLGAAAAFFYASGASRELSAAVDAVALEQQVERLQKDVSSLRVSLQQAISANTMAIGELAGAAAGLPELPDAASGNVEGEPVAEPDDAFLARVAERLSRPFQQRRPRFAEPDYDKSMERLMAAGFTAYDAERIFAIEAEAQLRFLESLRNPAMQGRETAQQIMGELSDALKLHLGDYGYENYLKSRNLPTEVEVLDVTSDSVAAKAGLLKGDKIVSYDGSRVFSIQDLQKLVGEGGDAGTVSVEIQRDGSRQLLTLDRGTIGIRARPHSPRAMFDLRPADSQ